MVLRENSRPVLNPRLRAAHDVRMMVTAARLLAQQAQRVGSSFLSVTPEARLLKHRFPNLAASQRQVENILARAAMRRLVPIKFG